MCSMGYRDCREYSTAVDLSLLVVECAMERPLDIVGQRFLKPDVYANIICRVTLSSLSFCHSSHVVVYYIL